MSSTVFFILALLCYFAVSCYFFYSLYATARHISVTHAQHEIATQSSNGTKKHRINRMGSLSLLLLGMICHAISLYSQMVTTGLNIDFSLFNILSLTTLLMLGFSLLFSSYRPIIVLNSLAAPSAAFGLIMGFVFSAPVMVGNVTAPSTIPTQMSLSMQLHIMLSIAAYSVLLMAASQAILLRLQNRELKHKTHTRVWVKLLPPLETMESLLFDMILLGFCLLSVALAFGWFGVTDLLAQHLAHKTVFSLLAWALFAWLIYGHWKYGWRGKRAANITLWAFGLLALGFIGTKTVLELIL